MTGTEHPNVDEPGKGDFVTAETWKTKPQFRLDQLKTRHRNHYEERAPRETADATEAITTQRFEKTVETAHEAKRQAD